MYVINFHINYGVYRLNVGVSVGSNFASRIMLEIQTGDLLLIRLLQLVYVLKDFPKWPIRS